MVQQERQNTVFCYQESHYQRNQYLPVPQTPTEMEVFRANEAIHGVDQVFTVDLELQSQRQEKVIEIQRLLKEVDDCCSKDQLQRLTQGK